MPCRKPAVKEPARLLQQKFLSTWILFWPCFISMLRWEQVRLQAGQLEETGATGNPQEQPADPSDNVEDEGFGDEDEGVASRLASLGGKKMASLAKTGSRAVAKPAAKVVAKAVPKTTQAVPKTTPAVPAGTVQPAAPVPKPSPSAKPSNQERRACWPSRVCLRWQFDSRLGLL